METTSYPNAIPRAHPADRIAVIGLLILAVVLRIAFALTRPATDGALAALPDQVEYLQAARNFIDGQGFCFYDPVFNDTLYAYRMPGYPLFVAMCGAKVWIVRIVQCLLDASLVPAAYLLARRLGVTSGAAVIGLMFVAFNPLLIYFSSLILSETLFTAMLVWGMLLILHWRRSLFLAGLMLLILSIYVRPSAIALPVAIAVLTPLLRPTTGKRSFWRIPAGATAVLLTIVLLLPWAIRNKSVVKAWVWTTTNTGITAYDGFNDWADGSSNQKLFRSWPEMKAMGEVRRSDYLGTLAREYASTHPKRVIQLAGWKIARTWSPIPLSDEYGQNKLYVAIGAVYAVPLFVLTVMGIGIARVDRAAKLLLLLPAIYFTAVHAMSVGSLRYRIPADVPMAVVAGAGAAAYWQRRRKSSAKTGNDDGSVANNGPD